MSTETNITYRVSHAPRHPTIFFETPPPSKPMLPMPPPSLENKAPHPQLKNTPRLLKSEAPFQEMT